MNSQQPLQPVKQHTCRVATDADKAFIADLSRRFTAEIGYLAPTARTWYTAQGGISIALENGEPAGFLLYKPHSPAAPHIVPIFQAAICYDAQRRHHGTLLVEQLIDRYANSAKHLIQLWCRADLEANDFWHAARFTPVAVRTGGKQRNTPHLLWRRAIHAAANLWEPADARRRNAGGQPVMLDKTTTAADFLGSSALDAVRDALGTSSVAAAPAPIAAEVLEQQLLWPDLLRKTSTIGNIRA